MKKALLSLTILTGAVACMTALADGPAQAPAPKPTQQRQQTGVTSDDRIERAENRGDERIREAIERELLRESATHGRYQSSNAQPGVEDSNVIKAVPASTQDVKPLEVAKSGTALAV